MIKVPNNFIKALSATNAMKINAAATGKNILNRPYAVTHVAMSQADDYFARMIDTTELENLITTYWTQKYGGVVPTASTVATVRNKMVEVFSTSSRILGRFLCLKRVQDQFNLTNDDFGKVGPLFTNPKDININEMANLITAHGRAYDVLSQTTDAALTDTSTIWGDVKISSAEWTRTYTSVLKNLYLPIPVIEALNLAMAGVIELSSDDDETLRYVCMWMPGDFGADEFPGTFDMNLDAFRAAYISDYDSVLEIFSDYPIIKDIMMAMGYKRVLDYVDVRRDLSGQTLSVVRDINDSLEYSLKSILLAQVDVLNYEDRFGNSCIIKARDKYLPEAITSPRFNIICDELYNFENFFRGRLVGVCVSILLNVRQTTGHVIRALELHCPDNMTIFSDDHSNSVWSRAISTSIDAVTETDALQGLVLHQLAINDGTSITIVSSELEGSARTFVVPANDIELLIGCVLSAFYVNIPEALAALSGTTTYSVKEGVSTVTYFGADSKFKNKAENRKPNKSKNDKGRKEDKQPGKSEQENNEAGK